MFKIKDDKYFRRADNTHIKNVGLSISQWLPYPLAIWAFALDGNFVKLKKLPVAFLMILCFLRN